MNANPSDPFFLQAPWSEVDAVGQDTQTNAQVDQLFLTVPFDQQFAYVLAALRAHMLQEPQEHKVGCYFGHKGKELVNQLKLRLKNQVKQTRL
jgi:hypothetical protein